MSKSYLFSVQLIKKYKWQSVFFQYWKKTLPIFLLPFLIINCTIYFLFSNVLNKEFKSHLTNSCEKTGSILENIFTEIDMQYSNFAYNNYLLSYVTTPMEGNDNTSSNLRIISTLSDNFMATSRFIDSIYIYSTLNNYVYSTDGSNRLELFRDRAWYDNYEKTKSPDSIMYIDKSQSGDISKISVSYGIYSSKKIIGILVFNIDADYIDNIMKSDLNRTINSLYMVDSTGSTVYSTDNMQNSEKILNYWKSSSENLSEEITYTKQKNDIFLSKNILANRLTLIFDANEDYSIKRTHSVKVFFIICFVFAIIIPLLMALYISFKFYNSLYSIIASLSNSKDEESIDEISYIMGTISNLTTLNKNFEETLINRAQQLRRAQSMALQLQFNPHFLFNTLNMINLSVARYAHGDNDTSRSIVLLADLLQASMNTNDYVITLSQELDYEKKYIEIMSIQHDNSFEVEWDIDRQTYDAKVLKLILQPIIENAFQHGLKITEPDKPFKLKISSKIQSKNLVIEIFNSGEPIDEKRLKEITYSLENDDILRHNHVGLNNVNQRIKLLYGDAYGCSIESNSCGTTVRLKLPI